jgi:hypothetical protein
MLGMLPAVVMHPTYLFLFFLFLLFVFFAFHRVLKCAVGDTLLANAQTYRVEIFHLAILFLFLFFIVVIIFIDPPPTPVH